MKAPSSKDFTDNPQCFVLPKAIFPVLLASQICLQTVKE